MADLLAKAYRDLFLRNYKDAIENFLLAVEQRSGASPESPFGCIPEPREAFLLFLSRLLDRLDSRERSGTGDDGQLGGRAFSQVLQRICSAFGGDDAVLSMLGAKCLDEGLHREAEFFLQLALQVGLRHNDIGRVCVSVCVCV